MKVEELKKFIFSCEFDKIVEELYCTNDKSQIEEQKNRYLNILKEAVNLYGDGDYHFFSSPGRTEICGNHTDHQGGCVVTASINIDDVCVVKKNDDKIVKFYDKVFKLMEVDLHDLSVHNEERNSTKSLIRGLASKLNDCGYAYGGFSAYMDANVLVGSGISSSACVEVLLTEIYNYFYNNDIITPIERAKLSQWVENNYFGKPCGMMDQSAISVGSLVYIDFANKMNPIIEKQNFSFSDYGYELLIINTKGNHTDLTPDYATIPNEMFMVANAYNKEVLNEISKKDFMDNIKSLRNQINNDRAILRAYHFFEENNKSKEFINALKNKNINEILNIIGASGDSSYMYLQNVYSSSQPQNQSLSLALAMTKDFIGKDGGVCRVHGGGFAGTILVLIKKELLNEYIDYMSKVFGKDAILRVRIRNVGTELVI